MTVLRLTHLHCRRHWITAPPRPVPPRPAPPRIAGDVNSKAVTCDRLPKLAQRGGGGRKVGVSIFWGMN